MALMLLLKVYIRKSVKWSKYKDLHVQAQMNSYQQKTEEAFMRMVDDQQKTEETIQRTLESLGRKVARK